MHIRHLVVYIENYLPQPSGLHYIIFYQDEWVER